MGGLSYTRAGVDTTQVEHETDLLARILAPTMKLRTGVGRSVLPHGYYASALRISDDLALACCTDGVGSKVLVAEQMGKFDTIGIDCVAMNVNDMICIGAEPIAMLDYIAVERLHPGLLSEVAKGLAEGAMQACISIPGGETAQLPEIIRGVLPGRGLDLVGTAIGVVPMKRLNDGGRVAPGDVVIGLASSGVHSNGYTLARRALFEAGDYDVDTNVRELGTTVGEALLAPTRIYVAEAMELFEKVDVKALCHITGDGFLNLCRVAAPVGFVLDHLPPAPPIFDLIQAAGSVETAEMYRVFNMGTGLCVIVSEGDVDKACEIAKRHGSVPSVIGRAVADPTRTVKLEDLGLSGNTTTFA
ncbi:MAG TPA: phosphoribosylformylglycinamidine cyclo-ligase [Planctomycetota bacterium]|nr:phosphoribosylformylglycinamidine cyclo-ligase [Planctomycetota bacterium]